MIHLHQLKLALLSFAIISALACSSKTKEPPSASQVEEDTRILVKEALAKADRKEVIFTFNAERAKEIKAQMEKEPDPVKKINAMIAYAYELLKSGDSPGAIKAYNDVFNLIKENKIALDSASKRNLMSMVGISYMRMGENENCVQNHNHQSCFLPIAGEGIHKLPFGSSHAITVYESLLKEFPNDLETRYLLNLAYMTLGQYPDKVPSEFRIDPSWFQSKVKIQPFKEIAPALGINRNSHGGGAVMDDFTNDGWEDIVITSWSPNDQMMMYVNNGDGSFTDQTIAYGLEGFTGGLYLNQTDFNNDGWLDLYIMRGAWYRKSGDIPNTLLMNTGKGKFIDVTIKAGLTHHAATQASTWTDINLDGWLDLVVANESLPGYERGIDVYINQKNGTFSYETKEYGLEMNNFFKSCVSTYANKDKYPDLYFSTKGEGCFLYINEGSNAGKKGFVRSQPSSNIGEPRQSFPSWSFDYDNDGKEDLFTSAYNNDGTPCEHWMESHLGKADPAYLPKLYHNEGNLIFKEVGIQMGLTEVAFTMGCNYGDINTDGYLDFYLSTGNPLYQSLVPNKMYLNMEGRKFEDVSYSGGFANVQKGHAVAFGDPDHDGDEDIYTVIGGAFDGDMFYNCFFENPNEHNNNWVVLKLAGTTANKPAIGARVAISIQENGKERKIYRIVSSGASFGANSLELEVGLRKATTINNVSVQWPCKDCPDQVFTGMEINKAYLLTQDQSVPTPMEYNKVAFKVNEHAMHDMHH